MIVVPKSYHDFTIDTTRDDDEFDMFAQTRSSTFADSRRGFVINVFFIFFYCFKR